MSLQNGQGRGAKTEEVQGTGGRRGEASARRSSSPAFGQEGLLAHQLRLVPSTSRRGNLMTPVFDLLASPLRNMCRPLHCAGEGELWGMYLSSWAPAGRCCFPLSSLPPSPML